MKQGDKMVIGALAGLALCTAAMAVTEGTSDTSGASATPGNPYQSIVERNVFGLKPPPPPADPEANKPPPPKILLQGITTFGGVKRVLFKMSAPPKPGEQPKGEQSFVLSEGQRDGEIEVLEINPDTSTVKVRNYGAIEDLDFEKNGIKTPAAPGPALAGKPAGFVPPPAPNPAAPAYPAGASPFARPVRTATPTGATFTPAAGNPAPTYTSGTPTYYATGGGSAVPGGRPANLTFGGTSVPLSGAAPGQVQPQPQTTAQAPRARMSDEERLIMMQAYAEKMKQMGKTWPPPPPPSPVPQSQAPQ